MCHNLWLNRCPCGYLICTKAALKRTSSWSRLFSGNISISLNCSVGNLGMWTPGGPEFRGGLLKVACKTHTVCVEECGTLLSWWLSVSWKCAIQWHVSLRQSRQSWCLPRSGYVSHSDAEGHIADRPPRFRLIIPTHGPRVFLFLYQRIGTMWVLVSSPRGGKWLSEMFMRQKRRNCMKVLVEKHTPAPFSMLSLFVVVILEKVILAVGLQGWRWRSIGQTKIIHVGQIDDHGFFVYRKSWSLENIYPADFGDPLSFPLALPFSFVSNQMLIIEWINMVFSVPRWRTLWVFMCEPHSYVRTI